MERRREAAIETLLGREHQAAKLYAELAEQVTHPELRSELLAMQRTKEQHARRLEELLEELRRERD